MTMMKITMNGPAKMSPKQMVWSFWRIRYAVMRSGPWRNALQTLSGKKVYEEVTASIRELQATLQKRGEEIIADLREQAMSKGDPEDLEDSTSAITQFKSSMEDLTKSLDDTLASLKPAPAGV